MEDIKTEYAKAYFNFVKACSWMEKEVKNALRPFGITHAQLNALHILYRNYPKPVSVNAIKDQLLDNNPDVTRLLDRLVSKKLILRETCPENRRKVDITLAENGKDLFLKAHENAKKSVGNFFEDYITEKEAIELKKIFHKILK